MAKKGLLFDTLDEESKKKLGITQESLIFSIGSVHSIKMTEDDGITLKEEDKERGYRPKMAVIIAIKDDTYYGSVLVNSNPNTKFIKEEDIKKDLHPISKDDYSFIKDGYDPSFVDCGKLFSFTKERLKKENNFKGNLSPTDCNDVLERVKKSERIEPLDLIDFGVIDID
ncbi:hypothetical protein CLV62_1304 [Dysgonomonas alginatilytica]|uniref:Uncharacterized protein n=1 Tax=Dysgonomonas alginatilytica TaxID=1605892 RepID=A0A2V3PLC1_9BACT|nr:hypothetical protein [Dysgonomonas alginatilytica]PXV60156.1 hypothetical protein CLV62_1304 [Dysgonomonas alginatilytica]